MSCLLSADSDRSGAQLRVCPAKAGAGSSRCGATAPGPRGWETVSALLALRKNPLRALLGLRARWGSLVRVPVGKRTFHLVTDHQAAGRVLRDNARNYGKDTWSYGLLGEVLGTGLLTSEGRLWRERRRLAQPAFQGAALASVASTIVDCTDAMLRRWPAAGVIDVGEEMGKLTLDIVSRGILGVDLGDDLAAVRRHLTAVLENLERRTASLFDWPSSWPLPSRRRFRAHLRELDAIVDRIVARRRRLPGTGADLAGMLVEAHRAGELSEDALRDELKTFLVTGHETTANLLTWTLLLLGLHPDVERRARDQVDGALLDGAPSTEDLGALGYLRALVKEVLRLYPPVWLIERRAIEADVLSGYVVPAGALLAVCQYALHRDPDVFPDPEHFDPDRFSEPAERLQPPGAYLPFGAGSRACIGGGLAMMEAQLVIARILQTVRLEPLTSTPPGPLALITLRPAAPVRMRVATVPRARPVVAPGAGSGPAVSARRAPR